MNPYESTTDPDEPKQRRQSGLLLVIVVGATILAPVALFFWALSTMQSAPAEELLEPIPVQPVDQEH